MKSRLIYDHICIRCGKEFKSHSALSKFCSEACKSAEQYERDKLRKENDKIEQKRENFSVMIPKQEVVIRTPILIQKQEPKKAEPIESIEEIAKKASELNMSYGTYVARKEQKHGK